VTVDYSVAIAVTLLVLLLAGSAPEGQGISTGTAGPPASVHSLREAESPATGLAALASVANHSISLGSIPVGSSPLGAAVDATTGWLYVANHDSSTWQRTA
jgi:hypothetical protein